MSCWITERRALEGKEGIVRLCLLVSGGTIRLWRYSRVGNRPKFPYTSYTFTCLYPSNVYLIGMYP